MSIPIRTCGNAASYYEVTKLAALWRAWIALRSLTLPCITLRFGFVFELVSSYEPAGDQPQAIAYGIEEDPDGNMWVATRSGLARIKGERVTSLADAIGMRTALAASAIGYGAAVLFILSRIGAGLDETPVTITSSAPEGAVVS